MPFLVCAPELPEILPGTLSGMGLPFPIYLLFLGTMPHCQALTKWPWCLRLLPGHLHQAIRVSLTFMLWNTWASACSYLRGTHCPGWGGFFPPSHLLNLLT